MSNKTQIDTDAQALKDLLEKVRETEWNADIAREAIRIAERYRRKADNQRMMLNQLQKGGGSESIDKRVVQDALLERISRLNAEGEKSVNVARELIRFKRFVDGLTPYADRPTGEWKSEELANMICDGICYYKEVTVDADSLDDLCEGCLIKKLIDGRPTGRWKEVYSETDYRNGWIEFSCECCEHQHGLESGEYGWSYGEPIPWKFCPLCGAKMEGGDSE